MGANSFVAALKSCGLVPKAATGIVYLLPDLERFRAWPWPRDPADLQKTKLPLARMTLALTYTRVQCIDLFFKYVVGV